MVAGQMVGGSVYDVQMCMVSVCGLINCCDSVCVCVCECVCVCVCVRACINTPIHTVRI